MLRINDLCEYFPDDADEMQRLKKEILEVTRKIKVKNAVNQELVQNSLDYLNFSIGILAGTKTGTGTYGKEGNALENEARNFFDLSL